MDGQRKSRTTIIGLALAGVLGASAGAFIAGVLPAQDGMPEAGRQAWIDRLNGEATAYHQARVNETWTLRLLGPVQQRANAAWIDRLNGLADEQGPRGMSDRATQAWTDRLNGLTDAFEASQ